MTIAVQKTKPKKKYKRSPYKPDGKKRNIGFWMDQKIYAQFSEAFASEGLIMSQFIENVMIAELEKRNIPIPS
ncbi:hypothetical protein ACWATR_38330 [Nostoc sp. UIC 10890]